MTLGVADPPKNATAQIGAVNNSTENIEPQEKIGFFKDEGFFTESKPPVVSIPDLNQETYAQEISAQTQQEFSSGTISFKLEKTNQFASATTEAPYVPSDTEPGTAPIPEIFIKSMSETTTTVTESSTQTTGTSSETNDFKPFWETEPGIPNIFTDAFKPNETVSNVVQATPDQIVKVLGGVANGSKDLYGAGVDLFTKEIFSLGGEKKEEPKSPEDQEAQVNFNFVRNAISEQEQAAKMAEFSLDQILDETSVRWTDDGAGKAQIEAETGQKITSLTSLKSEVEKRAARMRPDLHQDLVSKNEDSSNGAGFNAPQEVSLNADQNAEQQGTTAQTLMG